MAPPLGAGGMGEVYKATDTRWGARWAEVLTVILNWTEELKRLLPTK